MIVEMAGSTTKGIRKRNVNTDKMAVVPGDFEECELDRIFKKSISNSHS